MLPTIRSAVEKQLNLIAQGRADFRQVLGHTLDVFKRKFHYFVDSIAGERAPSLPLGGGAWLRAVTRSGRPAPRPWLQGAALTHRQGRPWTPAVVPAAGPGRQRGEAAAGAGL